MSDAALLVLHEMGAAGAGGPWRAAFEAAGWPGPLVVPDLPGHGGAPAPPGGCYDLVDPALAGDRALEEAAGEGPAVVLGVGVTGWSAQVLAVGGRAAAVVLVDGLNGPWVAPAENIGAGHRWLRAVADDPDAVADPPAGGPDPRALHGVVPHGDRDLAERAAAVMPVPVLLVETPASPLRREEVDDLAARYANGAAVVRPGQSDPDAVAAEVVTWARSRLDA